MGLRTGDALPFRATLLQLGPEGTALSFNKTWLTLPGQYSLLLSSSFHGWSSGFFTAPPGATNPDEREPMLQKLDDNSASTTPQYISDISPQRPLVPRNTAPYIRRSSPAPLISPREGALNFVPKKIRITAALRRISQFLPSA